MLRRVVKVMSSGNLHAGNVAKSNLRYMYQMVMSFDHFAGVMGSAFTRNENAGVVFTVCSTEACTHCLVSEQKVAQNYPRSLRWGVRIGYILWTLFASGCPRTQAKISFCNECLFTALLCPGSYVELGHMPENSGVHC